MVRLFHKGRPGAMEVVIKRANIPALFRRATRSWFWILCADIYPALVAACIPWSTTAVAVFMVIWIVVLVPTIDPRAFLNSLRQPAYFLPVAFFALVFLGTLWADAPWPERLHGISPAAKLLVIPFLLYHFERSKRDHWVFAGFLLSCAVLLSASWAVLYVPQWRMTHWAVAGVPIKNTIDQSQEFALCVFALVPLALALFNQRWFALAAACAALIFAFLANLMFVALARTSLVYMPVLLLLFAFRYLGRRAALALVSGTIVAVVVVWFASPYLRQRVEGAALEYQEYRDVHEVTSTGERLEWWRRSLGFISEAPLLGHGTGSIKQLFDRDTPRRTGKWTDPVENPHSQTLNVAIQWGILGCLILYAMWYFHLLLFGASGLPAWIGLIVVVQNFVSSLFNSHLFDFTEGWIYVLGVGVAGGMAASKSLAKDKIPDARRIGVTITAVALLMFFVLTAGFVGLVGAFVQAIRWAI